jgi:hypothetical protein
MPGPGKPFQKGHPGGPGRPRGKTQREYARQALAQPSEKYPGLNIGQAWAKEFAQELDAKIRLDWLRWLEGASPKESVEPTEDDTTANPAPAYWRDVVRGLSMLIAGNDSGFSGSVCNSGESGQVEASESSKAPESETS